MGNTIKVFGSLCCFVLFCSHHASFRGSAQNLDEVLDTSTQSRIVGSNVGNVGCDEEMTESSMTANNLTWVYIQEERGRIVTNSGTKTYKGETIYSWNLENGTRSAIVYLGDNTSLWSMGMSHDGDSFVLATMGEATTALQCYSIKDHRWLWRIEEFDRYFCVGFSEDDKEVVAVGMRGAIYCIDTQTGKLNRESDHLFEGFPTGGKGYTRVFLSPSGRRIVIWQEPKRELRLIDLIRRAPSKLVSVWDIDKDQIIAAIPRPLCGVQCAAFNTNEDLVFLGCGDSTIRAWSLVNNKIAYQLPGNALHLTTARFSTLLAAGTKYAAEYVGKDGKPYHGDFWEAQLWDYSLRQRTKILKPFTGNWTALGVLPMAFSDDGALFAIERGGKLFLYNAADWQCLWSVETHTSGDK